MKKFCEKTRKFSEKNKDENCGAKKMRNFAKKNTEIINYDIIKLLMLSSQSRAFKNFVCAINCFSYKTYGFLRIFFAKLFFAKFRIVFAFFRLIHFREKM